MPQNALTQKETSTIENGLAALYKYGWDRDDCYSETAKLFDGLPEEYQRAYRDVEHVLKENFHIDRCVEFMVNHSRPTKKPGLFELNDRVVNPMDGYSIIALEGALRVCLDIAGRLDRMDYNLKSLLNMDSARSFFQDWVNAKPGQPVVLRGIGSDIPLYFKASDKRGKLPVLDIDATKESIALGNKDIGEARANDSAEVLAHLLSDPKRHLEGLLELRQDWGRVSEHAQKPSQALSQSA